MKTAFEAVWEHGQLVPVEASIRIHEHARVLVVILDEHTVQTSQDAQASSPWKSLKGAYGGKLSTVDEFISSKQDEKMGNMYP